MKRKRGRSRIKEVVLGIKRHVGRPRKKPLDSENDVPPPSKKKVGRPPKIKNSGGVVVDFGPIVSTYIASNIFNSFSYFLTSVIGCPCYPKSPSAKAAKIQAAGARMRFNECRRVTVSHFIGSSCNIQLWCQPQKHNPLHHPEWRPSACSGDGWRWRRRCRWWNWRGGWRSWWWRGGWGWERSHQRWLINTR